MILVADSWKCNGGGGGRGRVDASMVMVVFWVLVRTEDHAGGKGVGRKEILCEIEWRIKWRSGAKMATECD